MQSHTVIPCPCCSLHECHLDMYVDSKQEFTQCHACGYFKFVLHENKEGVVTNGKFTVKRLVKTPRTWVLHPENPLYKPIPITEDMQFEVWGVVTKVIIDVK